MMYLQIRQTHNNLHDDFSWKQNSIQRNDRKKNLNNNYNYHAAEVNYLLFHSRLNKISRLEQNM